MVRLHMTKPTLCKASQEKSISAMQYWCRLVCVSTAVSLLALCVTAVDKGNFKTCDKSSFCRRNRALPKGDSPYKVDPDSIEVQSTGCAMDIINTRSNVVLRGEISTLEGNMFRLKIDEKDGLRLRYQVEGALVGRPKLEGCKVQRSSTGLEVTSETTKVAVTFDPFQMDFYVNNEIAVVLNSRGLMNFEHYRNKKEPPVQEEEVPEAEGDAPGDEEANEEVAEEEPEAEAVNVEDEEPEMWEETFKTYPDSKPYGPSSVGLDISFPGVEHVYGLPEHADSLALKTTNDGDPYRLYNLDVFEYELNNRMALYGSIPLMLAHNWSKTVGVFWHNAAETWVDITNSAANKNILGKLLSYFQTEEEIPQTDTHWISESGIIDLFIILGPRPHDVFRQYSSLTGTTMLPPLFSIAYHQSRWNYNDENDVANVDEGFDAHDIPYDVLWLDIEHTNGKRYFTWDSAKFPTPEAMQDKLAAKGRKMVTIIDPHIKRDSNYHIHKEAESSDVYVKKSDGGSSYEGWCWPGSSSWIDFLSPQNRRWWAEQFSPDKYQGSTLNLFTWNDMNEPSVFNGPEVTMHKDCRHGDWEHRDVHNIYGMLQHQATAEGQILRSGGTERPFVLSRAFFAGTQRFGAIWTGDNKADWGHLKMSLPMLLSVSVAGLPFVGADVGGFFMNPDPELLVRWYQAGAFYPFFRAHAHLDTRRREPWLLESDKMTVIRDAIRIRYELLPLWYTVFYESTQTGLPVMRPLWLEYPRDKNTYGIEDQFLVGDSLMVRPVTEQYTTSVHLYLPGATAVWYDYSDYTPYNGATKYYINTPLDKIPVFVKGGAIVPKKMRVRRSSSLMADDPYTLLVALNTEEKAKGKLYIDDGHSYNYQKGEYLVRQFAFSNNQLTSSSGDPAGSYVTKSWLERVLVVGVAKAPSSVTIQTGGTTNNLQFSYDDVNKNHVLTIKKPGLNIATDFTISLNYS
ncbi:neutral alpha-glucosidase AB-like [Halichondria panicea]|uniref:neutral alpha-glucosidase AB-like n=1 Tax=Halichondria panicea TaxID=6063 RepID=UPI00312B46A5